MLKSKSLVRNKREHICNFVTRPCSILASPPGRILYLMKVRDLIVHHVRDFINSSDVISQWLFWLSSGYELPEACIKPPFVGTFE